MFRHLALITCSSQLNILAKFHFHLDSKQERGKFVAVSCLAVHVHIDWDQEEQAFQITLQEQDVDDE